MCCYYNLGNLPIGLMLVAFLLVYSSFIIDLSLVEDTDNALEILFKFKTGF